MTNLCLFANKNNHDWKWWKVSWCNLITFEHWWCFLFPELLAYIFKLTLLFFLFLSPVEGCHVQTVLQGSVSYLEKELTNACSSLPNGLVSHRHSVTVSCLEGFHRNGAEILTCSYGNWSEVFPKCEPSKFTSLIFLL